MVPTIHQLIAAISPDVYCDPSVRQEVKLLVKQGLSSHDPQTFLKAAELAQPTEPNSGNVDPDRIDDPFSLEALKRPVVQRTFARDAMGQSLEAFYFRLLNHFSDDDQWQVTKLIDDFEPSPGSTAHPYFIKQLLESRKQSDRLLERSRALLNSILQDLEKLKADQVLLNYGEDLISGNGRRSAIARTLLKQVWLENVEQARGGMSLLRLESHHPDRHLLDRFMDNGTGQAVESENDGDWLDDTLIQRREEFQKWCANYVTHLRKKVRVQRTQLRQQVHQLQLHARWLKPLLHQGRAANSRGNPELVDAFNTSTFRLLLLARHAGSLQERIERGELPGFLGSPRLRHYHPVLILELDFRATRNKTMGIRGRVAVKITGYGLNSDEIEILKRESERLFLQETLTTLDAAQGSIPELTAELVETALSSQESPTKQEQIEHTNPFSALIDALFTLWRWLTGRSTRQRADLEPDSHAEKILRSLGISEARSACAQVLNSLRTYPTD